MTHTKLVQNTYSGGVSLLATTITPKIEILGDSSLVGKKDSVNILTEPILGVIVVVSVPTYFRRCVLIEDKSLGHWDVFHLGPNTG